MTATSTPKPVAELVARLRLISGSYCRCARQHTISQAADAIATLTAERDAATARIAELEALHAGMNASLKACFGESLAEIVARAVRAETALAAATALASKARGAALEEAAEDERDRLYAEAHRVLHNPNSARMTLNWSGAVCMFLENRGAMLPAERAALRTLADSKEG